MHTEERLTTKGRRMLAIIKSHDKTRCSTADFCENHNISTGKFHWWKHQLKEHLSSCSSGSSDMFVRLSPEKQSYPFTSAAERINLAFPDGRTLYVPVDYPIKNLVTILRCGNNS